MPRADWRTPLHVDTRRLPIGRRRCLLASPGAGDIFVEGTEFNDLISRSAPLLKRLPLPLFFYELPTVSVLL